MFVSDGIKLTDALFQLGVDKTDAISVGCGSKAIIWNSEIKLKVPKMPFVNFAQINVYRRTGFIGVSQFQNIASSFQSSKRYFQHIAALSIFTQTASERQNHAFGKNFVL